MSIIQPLPSTCAVSVVIPMYNAAKYIGTTLESLLAQTFTDFEVIIADDCSTDSSCAVVESYMPRFGGRLKLSHMKRNSGGPGAPCNKSIAHARGKYIYQIDNDDLLVSNALETLYTAAEHFNADVVHMSRYIFFRDEPSNPFPARDKLFITQSFSDEIMLDPEDIGERIEIFCKDFTGVEGWLKFVRRDFLVENEIIFPDNMKASQDVIWTIELLYYAKRYLRIPQPLYVHRFRPDSVSALNRQGLACIEYWGTLLVQGLAFLCRFFDEQKFFRDNPQDALKLLDWFKQTHAKNFIPVLSKVPPHEAQKVLAENFSAAFGAHAGLIAYLCTSITELERRLKV